VVPLLVENGNFTAIVDLCLQKAKYLDLQSQADELEDLYNLVAAVVEAVDLAVTNADPYQGQYFSDSKYFSMFCEFIGKDRNK
jgi:hypothetical protein